MRGKRLGPKLTNCCKPEQVGTTEYGNILKRSQVLEDRRVPTKEARSWNFLKNYEKRVSEVFLNKFDMDGVMAQKGLWTLIREKVLQDREGVTQERG